MPLIVEDGTGVTNANSLCSVAFADAYFAERGITSWAGDSATVKGPALIRATDYIEARFGLRFKGSKSEDDQALSWPRDDVDILPIPISKATAEYALRALTQTLAPDPVIDPSNRLVYIDASKVGPISESKTYAKDFAAPMTFRPYPAADALLKPYLVSTSGVVRA